MTEFGSPLIPIIVGLIAFLYVLFESRAIDKARKQPPQAGIESLRGKTAKVIDIISEKENEKHLRVKLDGASWNAIARNDNYKLIKVDDTVKVTDIENQKLIVT